MNMDDYDGQPSGAGTTSSPQLHNQTLQNDNSQNPPGGRQSGNVTVYQTTGPDAYTSPITSPDGSGPALNPRSCVTCRRRKVRCDKQMPCSNCRRALIPCVFPAPGRAPRQPRPKDPNAPPKSSSQREVELVKRLRKLEGIVEELSGQIEVESGGKGSSAAGSPASPTAANAAKRASFANQGARSSFERQQGASFSPGEMDTASEHGSDGSRKKDISSKLGRIVLNDHKGSTRYVSNGFWVKLNDELDALRQDALKLTDDESDASDYEDTPDISPSNATGTAAEDHHAFIFGYRAIDVDLRSCHPVPSQIPFLWSVYMDNVEPLIKVLHVPTVSMVMRDARKNPEQLSPGNEALVFAIYYAAVISMEPDEVLANMNSNRDDLLKQFRFALEQSLARANFMYTPELVVVQAFTIFLAVVRRVDDSRFCWTLTSLVVRIAQGMGLHRDGSQFDLTPFEIEMRRRVWWAILTVDLRSAEEIGSELVVSENSFDTQMPTNINDVDITPTTTEHPTPIKGRSDTAVALARYEILMLSRRFFGDMPTNKNPHISPSDREALLFDAYKSVEQKFLKHVVDETDSLYWMAAMIARIIVSKMCLHIYQTKIFTGCAPEVSDEIRDRIFVAAIEVVEIGHRLNIDPRCKQFRWLFMTYTNWHAIAFNLIELCRRPWSALVERSWEAVTIFERDPVDLAKSGDHAAVFLPLRKLYVRARRHREAEIKRLQNDLEDARRLDWAERMNPAPARFGPIPGDEGRMERMREKWWSLVRPDGPMPRAPNVPPAMPSSSAPNSMPSMVSDTSTPTQGLTRQPTELSNDAMDMLDDLMTSPNPAVTSFWPHVNHNAGLALAMDGTNPTTDTQERASISSAPNDALRQQAMALQAQAASRANSTAPATTAPSGDYPPYMWSNAWGEPADIKEEDPMMSLDVMEGDFNWQDWGQTLQSFDMNGAQPPMWGMD